MCSFSTWWCISAGSLIIPCVVDVVWRLFLTVDLLTAVSERVSSPVLSPSAGVSVFPPMAISTVITIISPINPNTTNYRSINSAAKTGIQQ